MNNTTSKSIDFSTLTRAGEGLTQWRALGMGFITLLACGVLFWLAQLSLVGIGGFVGGLLSFLLAIAAFVVWVGGASAVGVLLMDKARNVPVRGIGEAFAFGVASVPKFLLLGVLVVVAMIAFSIVAAVIYYICKIPVLGAILAFVAHPLLVLIAATAFIACMWVVFPLFAPAVWSGLGFKAALASVFAIARQRIVQVVLMMMVLYIILMVIGMLIASGFIPAMASLSGLAASILGGNSLAGYGGYGGVMGMMGNSALVGAMLGMSVLGALIFALVCLVAMMGMNLLYLQVADGLDASDAEADLGGAIEAMREKAREAADTAKATAERARQAAADRVQAARDARDAAQASAAAAAGSAAASTSESRQVDSEVTQAYPSAASAPATPAASAHPGAMTSLKQCGACHHQIAADDLFCEHCGARQ